MISPKIIKDYLALKFKDDFKLSSGGRELVIPSIFIENDWKRHMSINVETGRWQCFKSGNKGNFAKLYSILEGCKYRDAESKLIFKSLWETGVLSTEEKVDSKVESKVDVAEIYATAVDVVKDSPAWEYFERRKITDKLQDTPKVFLDGDYAGRVVIPFMLGKKPFFFQARSIANHANKYKNPSGLWSGNFLYPFDTEKDSVVVCEGPIDAVTLNGIGINATCTMGCSISRTQMELLSTFCGKVIVGYNPDKGGKEGIVRFDTMRKILRLPTFYLAFPPSGTKDWNEAYCKNRTAEIRACIEEARPYDTLEFMLNNLEKH